jgi:hypothetical protein
MNHIYFGLLCEGSTDRAALPPLIEKALAHLRADDKVRAHFEWDIDGLAGKSSSELIQRAAASGHYDVILAHMDGAGDPDAIWQGVMGIEGEPVPVVPVRETEAWLIVDPQAFLRATRASALTRLPQTPRTGKSVERCADPKALTTALLEACLGRRPESRDGEVEDWYGLVAARVRLEKLLQLQWFGQFVLDLRSALQRLGWPFRG